MTSLFFNKRGLYVKKNVKLYDRTYFNHRPYSETCWPEADRLLICLNYIHCTALALSTLRLISANITGVIIPAHTKPQEFPFSAT